MNYSTWGGKKVGKDEESDRNGKKEKIMEVNGREGKRRGRGMLE